MKATTTTSAMEAPKICCGCNMKTFSLVFGIMSLIGTIIYMPILGIIYGKFAIAMIIFNGIMCMNYFAVGCTDNPFYSKTAQIFMYVTIVMTIAQVGYMIWDLNNESSAIVEAGIEAAKLLMNKPDLEVTSQMKEEIRNAERASIKGKIGSSLFTIIIYLYIASKYGENADYLEKKKNEEAKVHIAF